jgi:hypothetical protein
MKTNLFERYVAEIGKHLPIKERSDIQKEILSTLEDMLEERAAKAGGSVTEEMGVELLKEFGKPEDVAASYLPERHLIGPQLYPIFSLIVTIVLPILATILLITMGFGLFAAGMTTGEVFKTAGTMLLQLISALISAFGSIVLTFAILERVFGVKEIKLKVKGEVLAHVPGMKIKMDGNEPEAWNPRDLPEVQDVEKFSIPGLVAEIVFTLVAVIIFNFFPQIIGFTPNLNSLAETGNWQNVTIIPILSEAFFRYMPYLNALWGLQIVLDLILLRQGRWHTVTRWLRFTLTGLGIALAAVMLAGPDLIGSISEALSAISPGFSVEAAKILTWLPRIMVKVALLLVIVLNGLELVKSVFKEITGKSRL